MNTIHVTLKQLYTLAHETLLMMGVKPSLAQRGAATLNAADARGVDSHGVARLKFYDKCIGRGEINPNPAIRIIKETPVSAFFDCDNGIGIATADLVMDKAIALAKQSGVGICTAINGHHIGVAGHYALKAAKQDLIGFACAPSRMMVAPTGGKEKMLGNSPNSLAFPAGLTTPPILMDMASTTVPAGKVEMAVRRGEPVPIGWILDKEGNDTTNPADFQNTETGEVPGSLLPMAGAKGYCIIVMIELLSSILSGAKTGPHLATGGGGMGFFAAAIDPEIIRPLAELKKDLDEYYHMIKRSEKRNGVQEIYLPGEIEHNQTIKRMQQGVDLSAVVAGEVLKLHQKYGRLNEEATIEDLFQ
jgi:L-2-hydroxycarboxylate dehydrogenase (NAD+)